MDIYKLLQKSQSYGELRLSPEHAIAPKEPERRKNGTFVKGHTPFNKGKKIDEWASIEAQKAMSRGWENLKLHKPKYRSDKTGRPRQEVVAITDDGSWRMFRSFGEAASILGINKTNVIRCAKLNMPDGSNAGNRKVNTDHKYYGYRFYYESDDIWIQKIKS